MFNPDFYPTPPNVAATMLDPLDLRGRPLVSANRRHWRFSTRQPTICTNDRIIHGPYPPPT